MSEQQTADPITGLRCMAIWLRSAGFNSQAEDCDAYAEQLRAELEAICQLPSTRPVTRAQLRHLAAGVDWRKVK